MVSVFGMIVRALDDKPLQGVIVEMGNSLDTTNDDGKFNLDVQKGTYQLVAMKDEFATYIDPKIEVKNDILYGTIRLIEV